MLHAARPRRCQGPVSRVPLVAPATVQAGCLHVSIEWIIAHHPLIVREHPGVASQLTQPLVHTERVDSLILNHALGVEAEIQPKDRTQK